MRIFSPTVLSNWLSLVVGFLAVFTVNAVAQDNPCEPLAKGGFFNETSENLYRKVGFELSDFLSSDEFREFVRNESGDFTLDVIVPTEVGPVPLGGGAATTDQEINRLRAALRRSHNIKNSDEIIKKINKRIAAGKLIDAYVRCVEKVYNSPARTGVRFSAKPLGDRKLRLKLEYVHAGILGVKIISDPVVHGIVAPLRVIQNGISIPPTRIEDVERKPNSFTELSLIFDNGDTVDVSLPPLPAKQKPIRSYTMDEKQNNIQDRLAPDQITIPTDSGGDLINVAVTLTVDKGKELGSVTLLRNRNQFPCDLKGADVTGNKTISTNSGPLEVVHYFILCTATEDSFSVNGDDILQFKYSFPIEVQYAKFEVRPTFIIR